MRDAHEIDTWHAARSGAHRMKHMLVIGHEGRGREHPLAQQGAPILELVYLEDLSNDAVYEFAFIGGSLKLRAADGAPIRPIAIPLR